MSNTYYLQKMAVGPAIAANWPQAFTPVRNDDGAATKTDDPQDHLVTVNADSSIVTIVAAVICKDVSGAPTSDILPDSIHTLKLFRKKRGTQPEDEQLGGTIIIPKPDTTLPTSSRLQVTIGDDAAAIADLKAGDELYVTVTNNLAWDKTDPLFERITFMYAYLPR